MKRILVTGADGQLGKCLMDNDPGTYDITFTTLEGLDITDKAAVQDIFEEKSIDICVNCAAYTAVDKAETESDKAYATNADGPENLALACLTRGALLIHISTDYVYDNGLERPIRENDILDPESVYAVSKLEGEDRARYANPRTVVLRTSWVYSHYGHNFVKTMLQLGRRGIHPKVVNDQVGAPTYAADLAKVIYQIITKFSPGDEGVYNCSNSGSTNWADFAREIFKRSGMANEVTGITTEEYGAAAPRPAYSVLDNGLIASKFDIHMRPWQDALDECLTHLADTTRDDN